MFEFDLEISLNYVLSYIYYNITNDNDLVVLTKNLFIANHLIQTPSRVELWSPKRKKDFFCGRIAVIKAFETFGLQSCFIGIDENGLPILTKGFLGSISHSNGCAVALIARQDCYRSVGVDVQSIIPLDKFTL